MITFSNLGKPGHGRLGNQLFQIASTLGIAEKNGQTAGFPAWSYAPHFEPFGYTMSNFSAMSEHKEKSYEHYDIKDDGIDLVGWFQSEKYFGSQIPKLIGQKTEANTIAISIRRGDYVGNPNYYEIPIHWYISALLSIPDWRKHNILFFSDDIEYCRVHFECLPNAQFIDGTDIEQLRYMANCEKHIIANSTFSWWGAYLSGSTHVIHSGRLFAGKLAEKHTGADFYPQSWIQHEGSKIDLTDVTFTVPVYFDHSDRKQNLDLTICMLQRDFDTHIMVVENAGDKFEYMSKWVWYTRTDHAEFHRTKMLNDMCKAAVTPIVCNFDCDIIVPPMQLWLAVDAIRGNTIDGKSPIQTLAGIDKPMYLYNGAKIVYPYDGRFARVPRLQWFKNIEKRLDIGIVGNTEFKGKFGKPLPTSSVGGVLLYLKEAFIDAGMENENFISYGPEDAERWDRFHILEMDVRRITGAVYHIDHFIGINSTNRHPNGAANKKELEKVRSMDKVQLRAYVDTWPWVDRYTPEYYQRISAGSTESAKHVFAALFGLGINPRSVLDVGCGCGAWYQRGMDWTGIDHGIPKEALFEGVEYLDVDLVTGMLPVFTNKFDLALCLEVAEHLPQDHAEKLVAYLTMNADKILFSAAIPHQGGTGHINEQWQSWWEKLFNKFDFGAVEVQPDIRNNPEIEMWYRQNTVLYARRSSGKVIDYVLPEYYEQCMKNALNL